LIDGRSRERARKQTDKERTYTTREKAVIIKVSFNNITNIMSSMEAESVVTLASAKSGMSESLPVALSTTTVQELSEWCCALFGLEGEVRLFKDGKALDPGLKLEQAGVCNGDLLAAQEATQSAGNNSSNAPRGAAAAAGGGLDFSNLLGGASAAAASGGGGGSGLDFSSLLSRNALTPKNNAPVYFAGMSFEEAWENNPTPEHIVSLLQSKEQLFKGLNYHQPKLANKIRGQPYDKAVQIWREEIIKGGIQTAMSRTTTYHKENDMKRRLNENPNDEEVRITANKYKYLHVKEVKFNSSCSFIHHLYCSFRQKSTLQRLSDNKR
jgi:hypothetical protein